MLEYIARITCDCGESTELPASPEWTTGMGCHLWYVIPNNWSESKPNSWFRENVERLSSNEKDGFKRSLQKDRKFTCPKCLLVDRILQM